MADGLDVNLDITQVKEALDNISNKEFNKIVKRALGRAAGLIIRQSRANLRRSIGKASARSKFTNATHGWNLKRNRKGKITGVRSLEEGIRGKYHFNKSEYKLNIMQDFRLKWFEKGTKERSYKTKTGKTQRTGKMKANWFFKDAQNQKMNEAQSQMEKIVHTNIEIAWITAK